MGLDLLEKTPASFETPRPDQPLLPSPTLMQCLDRRVRCCFMQQILWLIKEAARHFALGGISDHFSEDFYGPQIYCGGTDFAKT